MTDATQFEAFVRQYQDMVFATAVRLLGRPADAEDIAQTAFLKAFERFDAVVTSPSAAGWLRTVTTNLCLNHLSRYRARWRFFSELPGASGATPVEAAIAARETADGALDERQRHERLEQALRALPDHQRVPIALFHFEEKSYQEIADLIGTSIGKVKTDIHRGRETLRRLIQDDDRLG